MIDEIKSIYSFNVKFKGVKLLVEKSNDVDDLANTDRYRLMQVLVNLIGNAFKFTFEGSITLKISKDEKFAPNKLKFSVIDTGLGIKEHDMERLFQAFGKIKQENTSVNTQGVGLGLMISNEIVKALNGENSEERIYVESEYGKGTCFSFYIPIKSDEYTLEIVNQVENIEESFHEIQVARSDLQPKTITGTDYGRSKYDSLKILVADDNPYNLHIMKYILNKFNT
mmetsp:Transcript_9762/g.8343  ORF Transcript_9762/g.8343 Transcript_9762/m.8343 type:complete len:226 (+) Transcript_9762:280-957(+)